MAQYGRRVLQPALTSSFLQRIRASGPVRSAGGGRPPEKPLYFDGRSWRTPRPKKFGEKIYDWAFPAETPEEQRRRDYRRQLADDLFRTTDKIMSYHYGGKGDNMAEDNKILGEIGKYGKTEEEALRNYKKSLLGKKAKEGS